MKLNYRFIPSGSFSLFQHYSNLEPVGVGEHTDPKPRSRAKRLCCGILVYYPGHSYEPSRFVSGSLRLLCISESRNRGQIGEPLISERRLGFEIITPVMTIPWRSLLLIDSGASCASKLVSFLLPLSCTIRRIQILSALRSAAFSSRQGLSIFIGWPYRFASLIALIVFIGLSFLQFTHDSLALMDENLV
jgi:hypothetical protein